MKIRVAKSAGFCFGVKRAVEAVYGEIEKNTGKIYTYGPIIHNEQVVADLTARGVEIIENEGELSGISAGTIIIRSHGVPKRIYDLMQSKGLKIVDCTCPFVKKIHNIVREKSKAGYNIIIIGNENHPEVEGIKGWVVEEKMAKTLVIDSEEKAAECTADRQCGVCVVSQTTFNCNKFDKLVEILDKRVYNTNVVNTICNATTERQREAAFIARQVDAMIVIGGKSSSNTQKLYEICKEECYDTYYIQSLEDLDLQKLQTCKCVGITAGASTPNNIIEEVQAMSELSFEQLLDAEALKPIRMGDVVEGTVIAVKEDEIVLNIGYKADGIITRNEYTNTPNVDLTTVVAVGDQMEAKVLKVNDGEGQVLLTYKRLAAEKGNKRLEEAFENKEVIRATVSQILAGGLSVTVEETKVFIPASLVSDTYEKDLSKYAGQEIEFVISEFNPKRRRIIGDRKQLLVAEKKEKQAKLLETIREGQVIEGTVKNVTDFGAFIDLGGIDGLLHISEMSWGRVEHPKKVFKVGDVVKALVKEVNGTKIALSLKFDETNPWVGAKEKYSVGKIIKGKIARMTDFGAFVELEPGVDALLHVSQISKEHVEKPSDVLKAGDEIEAKIVDFNENDKKISLSIKALEADDSESGDDSQN